MSGTDTDIHLRHALEHAPDCNVAPDWRWRKSILKKAHDAVGEPDADDAEAELERAAQSWWQRMGNGESNAVRKKSRKSMYVAIATLMIALVAVMLWRRDPAREPAFDGQVAAHMPSPADSIAIPRQTPTDTASIPLLPPSFFEKPEPAEPAKPNVRLVPPDAPLIEPSAPTPKPASLVRSAAVAPVPPSPALVAPAPKAQKTPSPAASSPAPPAQQPQREARLAPPPEPPAAPVASTTTRTDATEPPTFDALSQWNRITITHRGGETRSLPRAEAREVSALMTSAALSAVGPQPMKGAPEWRVTLERGADQLAVFEVSGAQVRWREGSTPAATGTPSAGSIAALRDALSNAVKESEPPGEPPRSP